MSHLPGILAKFRTSLVLRLLLLALSATLLVAPLIGAGILLTTRPVSLRGLAARVAVSPQGQANGFSPSFQPPRQAGCQGQGCSNQDPIREGCVADAVTQASVPIVYDGSGGVLQTAPLITIQPGAIIGRLDRRYSPSCQAYWARVFSFAFAAASQITLSYGPDPRLVAPTFPTHSAALSLYSDMTPTPQPATAIITLSDATNRQFPMTAILA